MQADAADAKASHKDESAIRIHEQPTKAISSFRRYACTCKAKAAATYQGKGSCNINNKDVHTCKCILSQFDSGGGCSCMHSGGVMGGASATAWHTCCGAIIRRLSEMRGGVIGFHIWDDRPIPKANNATTPARAQSSPGVAACLLACCGSCPRDCRAAPPAPLHALYSIQPAPCGTEWTTLWGSSNKVAVPEMKTSGGWPDGRPASRPVVRAAGHRGCSGCRKMMHVLPRIGDVYDVSHQSLPLRGPTMAGGSGPSGCLAGLADLYRKGRLRGLALMPEWLWCPGGWYRNEMTVVPRRLAGAVPQLLKWKPRD
eukprot:gene12305-biopygen6038